MTKKIPVLDVQDLEVRYRTRKGLIHAVRGIDLTVNRGEIVGLVGESGCGKSAALLSTMRLLASSGSIVGGSIRVCGKDVLSLGPKELRAIRGNLVSMVFQDPMSTLNPSHRIRAQMREAFTVHGRKPEPGELASLLLRVGIPSPETVLGSYPHELSGGMQQRVMIAIALSGGPELILADEPTTALDVTIQAQILRLLMKINEEMGVAILLVTHNLAIASQFCHRVCVMYAGQIVEEGPAGEVLANPLHPYTEGLLRSLPRFERDTPLVPIPGTVPDLQDPPPGCAFYPRCTSALGSCPGQERVPFTTLGDRRVRCLKLEQSAWDWVAGDSEW